MFASYIKNLETHFAILTCFEFWPLCIENNFCASFEGNVSMSQHLDHLWAWLSKIRIPHSELEQKYLIRSECNGCTVNGFSKAKLIWSYKYIGCQKIILVTKTLFLYCLIIYYGWLNFVSRTENWTLNLLEITTTGWHLAKLKRKTTCSIFGSMHCNKIHTSAFLWY